MQVLVSEIIDRARMFAQDDMNDNKGAILKPERWLQQFNALYRRLYKRWLMAGLITPPAKDREFMGGEVRIGGPSGLPVGALQESPGVVAVQGVVRGTVSGYRGAIVDLAEWFDGCPSLIIRLKDTTDRPTFTAATGVTASFVKSGSAFTLTVTAASTTFTQVLALLTASTDIEVLFYTPDSTYVFDDLLAAGPYSVMGGEVLLSDYSTLHRAQRYNRTKQAFGTSHDAPGSSWEAFNEFSTVRVSLRPRDQSSQQYVVRYYELPKAVVAKTEYVTLPDNCDDLMAMKLAEVAMMTEGGSSKSLQKAIMDNEAELAFSSFAMLQPRLLAKGQRGPTLHGWPTVPAEWVWF